VGGGALPTTELETWLVTLRHDALSPDALAARLLEAEVPIVVRISEGEVWLDVRTVADEEIGLVARTLQAIDGARGVVTEPASVPSDSQRQRQDGRLRS
jgi:L-seryl-tRNA(Ser) seleniumtransferase